MFTLYSVVLSDVHFATLYSSERRTALHVSEFAGHEKHYFVSILDFSLEIIWRKGHTITFRQPLDAAMNSLPGDLPETVLETATPMEAVIIKYAGREHEISVPHACLETFCQALDQIELNQATELDVPLVVEQMIIQHAMKADRA